MGGRDNICILFRILFYLLFLYYCIIVITMLQDFVGRQSTAAGWAWGDYHYNIAGTGSKNQSLEFITFIFALLKKSYIFQPCNSRMLCFSSAQSQIMDARVSLNATP